MGKSYNKNLEFIDQNFEIFRFFKILLLPTMKSITFCAILFLRLINHCECKPVQNIAIKTENGYENSLFAQLMIKQFDYGSDLSIGNWVLYKRGLDGDNSY